MTMESEWHVTAVLAPEFAFAFFRNVVKPPTLQQSESVNYKGGLYHWGVHLKVLYNSERSVDGRSVDGRPCNTREPRRTADRVCQEISETISKI